MHRTVLTIGIVSGSGSILLPMGEMEIYPIRQASGQKFFQKTDLILVLSYINDICLL
jgi:hypothetical protein